MTWKNVDWDRTNRQVTRAAKTLYKGRNFVPSKIVAKHIDANRTDFSQFKELSYTSVLLRTTTAMKKMNWRVWGSSGKRGTVFIPPWAKEP